MVLGFKHQFAEPIIAGSKIHTIREDVHNRWKQGNTIHFATGVRTKKYNNFKTDVCKSVQDILIEHTSEHIYVTIDGYTEVIWRNHKSIDNDFYSNEVDCPMIFQLAKNDGFKSVTDFFRWFDGNFKGKIIHWTDFKYIENSEYESQSINV